MKVVICEDEQYWMDALKASILRWTMLKKIELHFSSFASPKELLNYLFISPNDIDVLFLDISLGEKVIDGMTLAKNIRKMQNSVPIIFVTIDSYRAAEGYLVDAMGFLVKPINDYRLGIFLNRIIKKQKNRKMVNIISEGRMTKIYQDHIIYVEIIDHTVIVHTLQGNVNFRSTLNEIFMTLDKEEFIQCHRSYIIAINKIESIKTTYPYNVNLLKQNELICLPISRKYINNFLDVYANNVWEKFI